MSSTPLQLDSLRIGYSAGRSLLAQPFSRHLEAGSILFLLGPNGSGKSTLLHTLEGKIPPLGGSVKLYGLPPCRWSLRRRARYLSFLPSHTPPPLALSVREWISLGRLPHTGWFGRLSDNDHQAIVRAAESCQVREFLERPLGLLSEGERQRVRIAQVLAQETPLLLLDEPTAHLDLGQRGDLLVLLRELAHQEGRLVLLSSHDPDLALQIADEIWLLTPGGELHSGTPDEFRQHDLLGRVFAGRHGAFDPVAGRYRVR